MFLQPLLLVCMFRELLDAGKVVRHVFDQFILLEFHNQLIAINLSCVKETGLMEISEVFGNILKTPGGNVPYKHLS